MTRLLRAWRLAQQCHAQGINARDIIARDEARRDGMSRRIFLRATGAAGAAAALAPFGGAHAGRRSAGAIVGAGPAGLACADRLQARGVSAIVYEAGARLGGRSFSNRTLVAGIACENGGELIDTGHKTVLGYANEFGLQLES